MKGYELSYDSEKIDDILKQVDEKTVYEEATADEHGLMSSEDKVKLSEIDAMTYAEIAEIVRNH